MGLHNRLYHSKASAHSGSAAHIHWADVQDTIASGLVALSTSSWQGATLALLLSQNESPSQLHYKDIITDNQLILLDVYRNIIFSSSEYSILK